MNVTENPGRARSPRSCRLEKWRDHIDPAGLMPTRFRIALHCTKIHVFKDSSEKSIKITKQTHFPVDSDEVSILTKAKKACKKAIFRPINPFWGAFKPFTRFWVAPPNLFGGDFLE
jgi:hypothetical protein